MKSFLYISLILSFTEASLAGLVPKKDCAPIDVRAVHPKIRKSPELKALFSTPRDQDSMGWCYAFAAADLLSAHLGKPISALHTSIIHNNFIYVHPYSRIENQLSKDNTKYKEVMESGNVNDAVEYASKNKWICSEKGLPFDEEKPYQIYQMLKELEKLKSSAQTSKKSQAKLCEDIANTITPFQMMHINLKEIAAGLINENINVILNKFASSVCKERIPTPAMKLEHQEKQTYLGFSNKNYLKHLNQQISRGNLVQFSYQVKGIAPFKGFHSSTILGRRWKNGKCEYNVRNSWGQSCAHYEANIECNKEEGTYWIPDEKLYAASSSISYFK